MGYGLMAYAVDIDHLRHVCGSGDEALNRAILERFRGDIERLDEQIYRQTGPDAPATFLGIRHLILGDQPIRDNLNYGYALKYVVAHVGRMLDNSGFYPCSIAAMTDEVDPELDRAGVPLRLTDLAIGGAPVPVSIPDDFPGIGHWSAESVAAAQGRLAAVTDPGEDLALIASWVETSAARGEGIVGFYH